MKIIQVVPNVWKVGSEYYAENAGITVVADSREQAIEDLRSAILTQHSEEQDTIIVTTVSHFTMSMDEFDAKYPGLLPYEKEAKERNGET